MDQWIKDNKLSQATMEYLFTDTCRMVLDICKKENHSIEDKECVRIALETAYKNFDQVKPWILMSKDKKLLLDTIDVVNKLKTNSLKTLKDRIKRIAQDIMMFMDSDPEDKFKTIVGMCLFRTKDSSPSVEKIVFSRSPLSKSEVSVLREQKPRVYFYLFDCSPVMPKNVSAAMEYSTRGEAKHIHLNVDTKSRMNSKQFLCRKFYGFGSYKLPGGDSDLIEMQKVVNDEDGFSINLEFSKELGSWIAFDVSEGNDIHKFVIDKKVRAAAREERVSKKSTTKTSNATLTTLSDLGSLKFGTGASAPEEEKSSFKEKFVTRKSVCWGCSMRFDKDDLSTCTGCKAARYCGKKCQKTDWIRRHKEDCQDFNKVEETESKKKKKHFCWFCTKSSDEVELLKCVGCRKGRYCGDECQRNDWERHGDYCRRKQHQRTAQDSNSS